jgi:hypothetical protein
MMTYDPTDDVKKYGDVSRELGRAKGVARRQRLETEQTELKARLRRFGFNVEGKPLQSLSV